MCGWGAAGGGGVGRDSAQPESAVPHRERRAPALGGVGAQTTTLGFFTYNKTKFEDPSTRVD